MHRQGAGLGLGWARALPAVLAVPPLLEAWLTWGEAGLLHRSGGGLRLGRALASLPAYTLPPSG